MQTKNFLFFLVNSISLLAFFFAQPAFAHGDEPRIEISADRLIPGSVLDIRGVDFEMEEEVILSFVGPQADFPLGTVIADTEGIFLLTVTLPTELTEGLYVIRATTDDHILDSPQITIWGIADLGGGEEGPWEEGDTLLAPMPTFPPTESTPVSEVALPVESTSTPNAFIPAVWIAAGIGLILLLGVIIKMRR